MIKFLFICCGCYCAWNALMIFLKIEQAQDLNSFDRHEAEKYLGGWCWAFIAGSAFCFWVGFSGK